MTTPPRTLADLSRTADSATLRRAIRQAEVLGYDTGDAASDGTRSELEREFLRLCRRHGISLPEVNVTVGSHTVDFLWRAESLIVEVDGWRYHRGHQAFERDRARDLDLVRLGFRVLRFSYHQVTSRSEEVAAAAALELVARTSS